jgi:hypothetical protein
MLKAKIRVFAFLHLGQISNVKVKLVEGLKKRGLFSEY